jgi:hypothetical protein
MPKARRKVNPRRAALPAVHQHDVERAIAGPSYSSRPQCSVEPARQLAQGAEHQWERQHPPAQIDLGGTRCGDYAVRAGLVARLTSVSFEAPYSRQGRCTPPGAR